MQQHTELFSDGRLYFFVGSSSLVEDRHESSPLHVCEHQTRLLVVVVVVAVVVGVGRKYDVVAAVVAVVVVVVAAGSDSLFATLLLSVVGWERERGG